MSTIKTTNSPAPNTNPDRTPVAHDVYTYCTKEKHETWHVVRNHNASGIVERVVCKACGSEHKYKSNRLAAAPARTGGRNVIVRNSEGGSRTASSALTKTTSSASGTRRPTGVRAAAAAAAAENLEETWFKLVKAWGEKTVRAYATTEHYRLREVFEHEVFGKGVVQNRRETKIDVLFREGMKVLPSRLKP
jgi:hypothetical protein